MSRLVELLVLHEIFALFCVIALGLLLSRLKVAGVHVGVSGVLFAGLGLGAFAHIDASHLRVIPALKEFGLILFVYCVGLSSGPGFFSAFRKQGLRLNGVLVFALACGAGTALLGGSMTNLSTGVLAGIFCGSLTNTPALGAATEVLRGTANALDPVLGYSLTYPFGVMGALLTFRLFLRIREPAFRDEKSREAPEKEARIVSTTCDVQQDAIAGQSIGLLRIYDTKKVIVSRISRGGKTWVPTKYTMLKIGDLVTIVGTEDAVEHAIPYFGRRAPVHLESDREDIDMRRILVSDHKVAGKKLREFDLERRFNAQVTRVRRADLDLVPSPEFRLRLGDRLRIVAPRHRLIEVAKFFGDSEKELAEVDYFALSLGALAGLVVGLVPLSIFGATVTLGIAGGPLVLALLCGRVGRLGPLDFILPYEVNQSLRQLGLLLFLAGVGLSAGGALTRVVGTDALVIVALGASVTLVTSLVTLFLATTWGQASPIASLGVTSGMQTQPATLAAAYELSEQSEKIYVAYSLVYPVAMIGKILIAQFLASVG